MTIAILIKAYLLLFCWCKANGLKVIISFIRLLVYEIYYQLKALALFFLFCYAYRTLFMWFSAAFCVKVSRVFFLIGIDVQCQTQRYLSLFNCIIIVKTLLVSFCWCWLELMPSYSNSIYVMHLSFLIRYMALITVRDELSFVLDLNCLYIVPEYVLTFVNMIMILIGNHYLLWYY